MDPNSPITATVADFCRLSGIGRSSVYLMIADGSLESITLGRRRLVILASYRRLIERCQQQQLAGVRLAEIRPRAS